MPKGSSLIYSLCLSAWIIGLAFPTVAQNQNRPITDSNEAKALNSIFEKWKIRAEPTQWNISGELCSGAAIDDTSLDDLRVNPLIKCVCTYNNATLCHITQLKVYILNVFGPIPEELWTLSYLTNLNLNQNYLTGSISPLVGKLTQLQYLSFGANALSGKIPKELGNLTELLSLSIMQNNFSGSLPSELGNLLKLEQLYISSCGISGAIPSTFANLRNLTTVWASDLELTGTIPDFIGNWRKLTALRLQGNAFQAPIPSTFSNLISLKELRLSDISRGSSSLGFIKDMKSLTILVLRNNRISDSIPTDIGNYGMLMHLDLSFNNIVGNIPDSLLNMSSLSFLFLGNNSLIGPLPTQKIPSLRNIDLSYNDFSGTLPSWVNEHNLQLNLVGNSFAIDDSLSSSFLSGLKCLQRDFPCNRNRPIFHDFAIKCGGSQITSEGITYESDNESVGPATYFVSNTKRWAVSSVGYFIGTTNPQYTNFVSSEFTHTLNPQLFQTSRLSASSLRYYGLGLENGMYTVILQFAETAFSDSPTWTNPGRRVFDIYIQGELVIKDFDIRKNASGASFRAVRIEFKANVAQNYLEIHLLWAGKGTCCIPNLGTYGPSISAISATLDSQTIVGNKPASKKRSRIGLALGLALGVGFPIVVSAFIIFCIVMRRKARRNGDEEILGTNVAPFSFNYAELKAATDDFSSDNKLGEGGFGPVYKGTLNDGRVVAVKRLATKSNHGKNQFVTEIAIVSTVQHRNLVKLHGFCLEDDQQLLVYEYLENKSLDQALFGKNKLRLSWSNRFDICLGVARGLAYLHEESRNRIIHRDIKAGNILLDADLNPKISDFGLARLYNNDITHISTGIAGTLGYLAPEYVIRGRLTEKTDVFAFGIVALEIVSGTRNSDSGSEEETMCLLEWAWNLYEENHETKLVDSDLSDVNMDEVRIVIKLALLCTQTAPTARPLMSRVVAMLLGDVEVSSKISRPAYLDDWKLDSACNTSTQLEHLERERALLSQAE